MGPGGEMVDTTDSKSFAHERGGSNPLQGIGEETFIDRKLPFF